MILDDLLRDLVARSGSDLHLLQGQPPKLRVHGELEIASADAGAGAEGASEPPDVAEIVLPILEPRHRAQLDANGEADLAYEVAGAGRFRVNVFRHLHGLGAVFRLVPRRIPTLAELNVPAEVEHFGDLHRGLVLVTGPTGSGKTSTLAALLGLINARDARHVVTIEDPIEFLHENGLSTFTQREIGRDADSFAAALRSAARQGPDLVLLGEMRDRETIGMALTLAEMGLLVFSTLHTSGAARTIDRIVEVFSEEEQPQVRTMLAETLEGVLSQILCRRADGTGRVPATELMFCNNAIRAVIREGASHKVDSLIQANRAQGWHRLDDSLFRLAMEGTIGGEDAWSKANEKERFGRFLPKTE